MTPTDAPPALTNAQWTLLEAAADHPDGHMGGTGPRKRVRERLQELGYAERRPVTTVLRNRVRGTQTEITNQATFITESGRDAVAAYRAMHARHTITELAEEA